MNQVSRPDQEGGREMSPHARLSALRKQLGEKAFVEALVADKTNGEDMHRALMFMQFTVDARDALLAAIASSGDLRAMYHTYVFYNNDGKGMPVKARKALLDAFIEAGNSEFAGLVLLDKHELKREVKETLARITSCNRWDAEFVLETAKSLTAGIRAILLGDKADEEHLGVSAAT